MPKMGILNANKWVTLLKIQNLFNLYLNKYNVNFLNTFKLLLSMPILFHISNSDNSKNLIVTCHFLKIVVYNFKKIQLFLD